MPLSIFISVLYFKDAISNSDYIGVKHVIVVNTELERIWKEEALVPTRYSLGMCLEGLRKSMIKASDVCRPRLKPDTSRMQVCSVTA
jgi:hypothetical protein